MPPVAVGPAVQALREPIEAVLASSGITGEAAQDQINALATSLDLLAKGQTPPPVAPPVENVIPLPERRSPATVAAAQHAERRAWQQGGCRPGAHAAPTGGRVMFRATSVCAARKASRRWRASSFQKSLSSR